MDGGWIPTLVGLPRHAVHGPRRAKEKKRENTYGTNVARSTRKHRAQDRALAGRIRGPYFVFRDAGIELTLASAKGGQPPIDPKSDAPDNQTPAMARFKQDTAARKAFSETSKLADMKAEDYGTVFYPGGHGPMWDLAESPVSKALIESFYNSGKPIAFVCHAPGVLRLVTYHGAPLVKGKHVTGFTDGEEEEVQLTKVVPFLVEDELIRLGAIYEKVANWQPFFVVDGRLITGQNPASSTVTAQALIKFLGEKSAHASA